MTAILTRVIGVISLVQAVVWMAAKEPQIAALFTISAGLFWIASAIESR